jgi:Pentapeptide repeats (8 copies)
MELKQKIDRLWNKAQPLTIPAVILLIIVTVTLFWKFQQLNVDSLQHKIESFKTEIAQSSSSNEKLKLEERLKLEKDILVIEKDITAIQNGVYTTIVQALGGGIVGFTAYIGYRNLKNGEETLKVGQKNLKVTEDKQVTERFSKAIEHLGNEKAIEVRLGGIYALEQIAIDSAKYHWTIVEILSAFIREKRPLDSTDPVGIDIQAALTIIGRRKVKQDPIGKYIDLRAVNLVEVEIQTANLSGANLTVANLKGADLSKAILIRSNLSGSILTCAYLNGANLSNAILSHADLHGAYLTDTNLSDTDLSQADLCQANSINTDFTNANLSHSRLFGADLSRSKNLTQDQLMVAIINEHTKLPDYLNIPISRSILMG